MSPALLSALAAVAMAHGEAAARWPPFLPPPTTFPPAIAAGVERAWTSPTITRQVEGERAHAPLELYAALVDAPEVTTAAARHLGIAQYEVRRLGPGWYHADDGARARGEYHVLLRERTRQVMFSRGRHAGRLLGTVTGTALTELRFEPDGGDVAQRLTAWVVVDNRVVAILARVFVPLFGRLADRKLQEGFRVTGRVAEWAATRRPEFCRWLESDPTAAETRGPVLAAAGCGTR